MQSINLLPQEYIGHERSKILKSILGIGLAIELGITGCFALWPLVEIHNKQQYLVEVQEKLNNPRFDEVKKIQLQLEQVEADYEKWSNKLSQIKTSSLISGASLDTLLGNVPVGVSIDRLEIGELSILIEGKTINEFSARGYISKLQNIYLEALIDFDLEQMPQGKTYSKFKVLIDLSKRDESEMDKEVKGDEN